MIAVSFHATPNLHEERPPGGAHTSPILRKGQILRLTDIDGGANVSMTILSPHEKNEHLNLPDTLKGQYTTRLTAGHCFCSDMDRVLARIVTDSRGWRDPFGGILNAEEIHDKYGAECYQELRNGFYRDGVDNLLVEMGKWDLGLEDLLIVVNFSSKVTTDGEGRSQLVAGNSRTGGYVELFAPMDVLLVLTTLPHPQDPTTKYAPRPMQLNWYQANDEDATIQAPLTRDENQRTFRNIQLFALQGGVHDRHHQ